MKNDAIVQTRTKKVTLATGLSFFHSKGVHPRSLSELVRLMLETFSEQLVIQHLAPQPSIEEAEYLLHTNLGSTNPSGRAFKGFVLNLQNAVQPTTYMPTEEEIDDMADKLDKALSKKGGDT